MVRFGFLLAVTGLMFGCESQCEKDCKATFEAAMASYEASAKAATALGGNSSALSSLGEAGKNAADLGLKMCKQQCK
jgi:hypothetical protein